jgi:hypothetical protein
MVGMQSIFERILAEAEDAKRTHHARMAKLTRAHFERHPECLGVIVGMDRDGNVIRSKDRMISVEARCLPGWASDGMMVAEATSARVVEAQVEKVKPAAPVWQLPGEKRPVNITEYMQRRHVPALRQAAAKGDLKQYNTYMPEKRFQARLTSMGML